MHTYMHITHKHKNGKRKKTANRKEELTLATHVCKDELPMLSVLPGILSSNCAVLFCVAVL